MNLRLRFVIFTAALVIGAGAAAWVPMRQLAENLIEQWAVRYAEKQVLYNKVRTLQPIIREIALARQFADSEPLKQWARNPDNEQLNTQAMAVMEKFRQHFAEKSYFVALLNAERYYHNNKQNEFAGQQYRYTLSRSNETDQWFYSLVEQERELHLNVNSNAALGVSKLWIDVLMRDGDQVLGVVGTGLDLTEFIGRVIEQPEPGITSFFVDHEGAIQIYRDQSMIDFSNHRGGPRKNLDLMFDRDSDRAAIREAMAELASTDDRVISRFVEVEGKRFLASVAHLPEVGWYEIMLMDLKVLLPLSSFGEIVLVYLAVLVVALALFLLALEHYLLNPLQKLEQAMNHVREGAYDDKELPVQGKGEVARLLEHFREMAQSVISAREELEHKVQKRTEALDRLTKIDPLTELLNRRGMTERIEAEISRSDRENNCFGIIWIDLDLFKSINDQHGHSVGDQALKLVSNSIESVLRPYDCAARWGGDEFLVLIETCDNELLKSVGERIRESVDQHRLSSESGDPVSIQISAGGYVANDRDKLADLLFKADQALYAAKHAGRNCFCNYDELPRDTETLT
ncbi:GGDEF domain-containing protein [Aestuariirhabdus sp. Z084]|uniref:GGDEF domain-containing protein n=1 Tax=Aestuariirhabdus haliotis TaxID=2918751 RepID=UPI00201B3A3B|nr:GGDEF domain-containing protein [Aestuariirhabdus haliotis]MCL6417780.1 GGDEF domain-containing protein [Aestuariirhabdus haliotis]MCL6421707.1 GGDEF domain-containing protein [Aestuariirhabdus haliotis]